MNQTLIFSQNAQKSGEEYNKLTSITWSMGLLQHLNNMRTNREMCDVKVLLGGGASLPAHSCVLSAASPFMKTMLSSGKTKEIRMETFPRHIVEQVVEFIYSGNALVKQSEMFIFQSAAATMDVPVLTDMATKIMQKNLENSNSVENDAKHAKASAPEATVVAPDKTDANCAKDPPVPVALVQSRCFGQHKTVTGDDTPVSMKIPYVLWDKISADTEMTLEKSLPVMKIPHRKGKPSGKYEDLDMDKGQESTSTCPVEAPKGKQKGVHGSESHKKFVNTIRGKVKENHCTKQVKGEECPGSQQETSEESAVNFRGRRGRSTSSEQNEDTSVSKKVGSGGPQTSRRRSDCADSSVGSTVAPSVDNMEPCHIKQEVVDFEEHVEQDQQTQWTDRSVESHQDAKYTVCSEEERSGEDSANDEDEGPQDCMDDAAVGSGATETESGNAEMQVQEEQDHGDPDTESDPRKLHSPIEVLQKRGDLYYAETVIPIIENYSEGQSEKQAAAEALVGESQAKETESKAKKRPRYRRVGASAMMCSQVPVHSGPTFMCVSCSRCFTDQKSYEFHLNKHQSFQRGADPLRKFPCRFCEYSSRYKHTLQEHENTHTGNKPYKCSYCDKCFAQKKGHMIHENMHKNIKYPCEQCGKIFSSYVNRRKHLRNIHEPDFRPNKCPFCSQCFKTSSVLKKHLRTHTSLRPYKCRLCPKAFFDSGELNLHVRNAHENSGKRYTCGNCGNVYKYKSSINKHKCIKEGQRRCLKDQERLSDSEVVATVEMVEDEDPQVMLISSTADDEAPDDRMSDGETSSDSDLDLSDLDMEITQDGVTSGADYVQETAETL